MRSVRKRFANRERNRTGAVSAEAALVTPMLVIVLVGAIDVGQYVNVAQNVSNASREGARIACRNTTESVSEVESGVTQYLSNIFPQLPSSELAEALNVSVHDEHGQKLTGTQLSNVEFGSPVTVQVSLEFQSVRWLKGVNFWTANNGTTATTGCRE